MVIKVVLRLLSVVLNFNIKININVLILIILIMNSKRKVELCLILNIILLILISCLISIFADKSNYFRIGPNPDFILISVKIDNLSKYFGLLGIIGFMNCIKVLVAELGEPVLVFNVYNPDKKIIDDFSKFQLLLYANSMFFVSNTRSVFEVMITVTQIDIAIYSVIIEQLVSIITVNLLVNEKKFIKKENISSTNEIEINTINNSDKLNLIIKN